MTTVTTMATATATEPRRSPGGDAARALDRALDAYALAFAAVARDALAHLRRALPGATLLVYDGYNALAVSLGPTARPSDAVLSVAVYPRVVRLFFVHGAALDDPARLLAGHGRRMRHLALPDAARLAEPAVAELVARAVARSPVPFPAAGGALVLQSVAATRRPRRPDA